MPETTSDELEPGDMGFTVVPASLNEMTPATQMAAPRSARLSAPMEWARRVTSKSGVALATIHIMAAIRATSAKGGSFNSRKVIPESLPLRLTAWDGVEQA